jgi:hypothetical protein
MRSNKNKSNSPCYWFIKCSCADHEVITNFIVLMKGTPKSINFCLRTKTSNFYIWYFCKVHIFNYELKLELRNEVIFFLFMQIHVGRMGSKTSSMKRIDELVFRPILHTCIWMNENITSFISYHLIMFLK